MKKKLVVFCDKYLGFTLLSAGGVLDDLVTNFDVTIITTGRSETVANLMQERGTIHSYEFKSRGRWHRLNKLISNSLVMTYAKTREGRRNKTGSLHRKAHWKKARKEKLSLAFFGTAICLSFLAQEFKPVRNFLVWLFDKTIDTTELTRILKDIDPALVIATTAGLGKDGILFAAARRANVRSLALIQSWDRTASKGYPNAKPDFCIVWNEAMAWEAEHFLEIPKSNIFTEGAPPWDQYHSALASLSDIEKKNFFEKWNLNPSKKLIFFAINGFATHDENIN